MFETSNVHKMGTVSREDHSDDYDSSCSSNTVPESSRSWMTNLSFGSSRLSSASGEVSPRKPHKANNAAWESIRWLRGATGCVGLDHFRLLRRLGSGDIGNVYLCQIRNPLVGLPQSFYAMKVVDREALAIRKKLKRAEMEKEILGLLDHPFLPTLYAAFDASHYSCLVMEFCPGGDLYSARQRQSGRRFSISSAKFYAAEVILAIEYLHMMGIVYRDLKPENVLIREDGHIMLSDFDLCLKCDVVPMLLRRKRPAGEVRPAGKGSVRSLSSSCAGPLKPVLSCFSKRTRSIKTTTIVEQADHLVPEPEPELVAEPSGARSKSFVGTHEYLAPEIISGEGHGSAVDWWTLGVFLYEMLYGKTPFKGENNEKTIVNILKQPLSFPRIGVSSSKEYSEMVKAQDLITRLLVKNQKKRIGSVKGSTEIKRHEFFEGVNWALIRSVKPPEIPRDLQNIRRRSYVPKLSKKERDEPYQIPHHHVDYF